MLPFLLLTPFGNIPMASLAEARPLDGDEVTLIGWGETSADPDQAELLRTLQKLESRMLSIDSCNEQLANAIQIAPSMVCDMPDTGAGSCAHDEGRPTVRDGKLVALMAPYQGCALSDQPDVDVDVVELRDWIYTGWADGGSMLRLERLALDAGSIYRN